MINPNSDIQVKSDAPKKPQSPVYAYTLSIINQLWRGGHPDPALMNRLRTAPTITSHGATDIWPLLFSTIDPKYLSHSSKPTKMEIAIFSALHCYAIYQHGSIKCMNATGNVSTKFMTTIARFRNQANNSKPIDRRIQPLLASIDISTTVNALYRLINILHAQGDTTPLDFAALAADLYYLQFQSTKDNVILHWGQQYYVTAKSDTTN